MSSFLFKLVGEEGLSKSVSAGFHSVLLFDHHNLCGWSEEDEQVETQGNGHARSRNVEDDVGMGSGPVFGDEISKQDGRSKGSDDGRNETHYLCSSQYPSLLVLLHLSGEYRNSEGMAHGVQAQESSVQENKLWVTSKARVSS